MKITHNKLGQNLNLTDTSRTDKLDQAKSDKTNSVGKQDLGRPAAFDGIGGTSAKVELSARAQDAKKIKEIALAVPDVDEAKVEKFRKLIDEGKYKVDSKAVANRMVDEHLMTAE